MSHSSYEPKTAAAKWVESRLPVISMMAGFMTFPSPRNLNWMWVFGAALMAFLVLMLLTGISLALNFNATWDGAFDSVQHIVRNVNYGWLIQSMHANGASFFFIAVYFHIMRGFYYGSYKAPRELLWLIGMLIYLLMMAAAFLGYAMINGEMSLAGAKVITGFLGAIPVVGEDLQTWLRGGSQIGNATISRFFALHYLVPFMILGLVVLHVWALHVVGNNNPSGVEVKDVKKETLPFHPYYTVKDLYAVMLILLVYAYFVFFNQDFFGDPVNYSEADPLRTPLHIKPEWYFLPFYAILRVFEDKLMGVLAMLLAVVIPAFLPWLNTSRVRSGRYRPVFKLMFWVFLANGLMLGYLGGKPINPDPNAWGEVVAAQVGTFIYFGYFALLPIVGWFENPKPVPASITEAMRSRSSTAAVLVFALVTVFGSFMAPVSSKAAGDVVPPINYQWSHGGLLGRFDQAQLQRGFQVYNEVCSTCHSLERITYGNLTEAGGPAFSVDMIKALAASETISEVDLISGEVVERPRRLSDPLPAPYDNLAQAATALGAAPPDLSLITKSRTAPRPLWQTFVDAFTGRTFLLGADYVTSLLIGYEARDDVKEGFYWNRYYPGHIIKMSAPLSDELVDYAEEGVPETVEQYSKDVTAFLAWASEPHLDQRKDIGLSVLVFLAVLTAMLYGCTKLLWAPIKAKQKAEIASGETSDAV